MHYDKLNLDENSIIERNIRYLSKIPKHLVVLLKLDSNEPIMFDNLTNLINWSLQCGISYISFYDYQGVLLENETKLYKMIEKIGVPDDYSIEWNSKSNSARISRKSCSIVMNIYSLEVGKQKVADFVINELLNEQEKCCDELTVESLDEKINSYYDGVPDPDVAVYFGRVRLTFGLLPWQIRLTEFIQIDNSYKKDLKLRKFLDVLYKYSKVEQRFGK